MKTDAEKRAYQRKYYRAHIEKSKAYQRQYWQKFKKNVTGRGKKTPPQTNLLKDRTCYTPTALMNLSDGAFIRACSEILSGRKKVLGLRHKQRGGTAVALSQ